MPRKKSVAPDPNEQEVMDQAADAVEGAVDEDPVGNDGAPSEETLALMEQEYLASSSDGAVPPEDGSDTSTDDNVGGGDTPPSGEDVSGSDEQAYDNESRSVVGSRREAMLRKRQTFYLDTDEMGEHLIYEGRVVQARVVAVAEKVIRVEVFGVETSIVARGLSWEWIGNARDHFNVGDRILVRVLKINRTDLEHLTIRVDARSVSATNSHDNLKKCLPQCRYAGRVTDVRNGVVFIRLNNGVNAIAHSCYDPRYPGKKDDVSFAVTRIDEEQGVAIGIITRIIKQNL